MRFGRALSPSSSPLRDSPPSPSSSDHALESPPRKRGRYSPGFSGDDFTDEDEEDDDDTNENESPMVRY